MLKTGSKSVLADLTPRGLEVVGLRIGDRVALEGEQKPSEIKVSKLERNGETFAIGLVRTAPAKMSRPCNSDQNCRGRRISNYWRTAAANQSILRCWGKKAAEFEELHIELDGGVRKTRPVSPHDHNGNPKWSSKAHLMNAETDRPA